MNVIHKSIGIPFYLNATNTFGHQSYLFSAFHEIFSTISLRANNSVVRPTVTGQHRKVRTKKEPENVVSSYGHSVVCSV